MEQDHDLHHVYHSDLRYFPFLRFLRKPIIYTAASGLAGQRRIPPKRKLRRLNRIVVPSESDLERLSQQGLAIGCVLPPAIDLSRFYPLPPLDLDEFVLMAGSAPWTRKQFRTKGVDALLKVAQKRASLRLVFLWRGLLSKELHERVDRLGIADRVEIIEERVDVVEVLKRVHAAVVLSDKPKLVKAYPHSLMEALACGRPVLISDCIAMSASVRVNRCGQVVRGVDESDILLKIQNLAGQYHTYQEAARRVGLRDFKRDPVGAYRELYETVTEEGRKL
jgi:glycosyltransferase involved in cell wall biosynthesis